MLTTKTVLLALLSATSASAAAIDSSSPRVGSTADCSGGDGRSSNGVQGIGSKLVDGIGNNSVNGTSGITCNQAAGDFNITLSQMYPEQADHDPTTCRTYFSILYSAEVAVYDCNTNNVTKIEVPDKSGNPALHASGVQVNTKNQTLSIMLNAGAAFDTQGKDRSGENNLVVWDLKANQPKFIVDLSKSAETQDGGFQDMEHDAVGNVFVMSTFGGSLYRVGIDDEKVEKWWGSEPGASSPGLTGLAKFGEDTLVVVDASEKQLFRHSMKDEGKDQRTQVKLQGELTPDLDGAYFPPKHDQKCLLVSDNTNGTIVVRSDDNWETAEIRGIIPNKFSTIVPPETKMGYSVATVQMGERIFAITEWFTDAEKEGNLAVPGTREEFPMIDITEEVGKLFGSEAASKAKTGAKPEERANKNTEATPEAKPGTKGKKNTDTTPKGKPGGNTKATPKEKSAPKEPEVKPETKPAVKPEEKENRGQARGKGKE